MAIPRTFRALSCANTSITTRASFPARSSELMGGKLVSNWMSTILPRTDTIVPTLTATVESGMRFSDATLKRILSVAFMGAQAELLHRSSNIR